MKRLLLVLALSAVYALAGCGPQENAAQDDHAGHDHAEHAGPDYAAIVQLLEVQQQEYAQAWTDLDMNKISEVWAHDSDVTIWGPAERDRVQGWDTPNGVKAWYEAAMGGMESCDFKMHNLLIKVSKAGTAAVVTYYVENDYVAKDGSTGKMTPRVSVVKELRDGVWKQIHGDASFSIAEVNAMK